MRRRLGAVAVAAGLVGVGFVAVRDLGRGYRTTRGAHVERFTLVPSPADVEQGTRLDPKELFRLLLVGVATGRISWSTRNRWWLKPSEITAAILATIRPDQARSARQRSIRTTT
ncbi:MAG: hypothetical protein E6G02_12385 [Actinobacteria bacterium]|nr:MAG: hypothetical protein E6G02_12385 [Actinomycetota bacterium]